MWILVPESISWHYSLFLQNLSFSLPISYISSIHLFFDFPFLRLVALLSCDSACIRCRQIFVPVQCWFINKKTVEELRSSKLFVNGLSFWEDVKYLAFVSVRRKADSKQTCQNKNLFWEFSSQITLWLYTAAIRVTDSLHSRLVAKSEENKLMHMQRILWKLTISQSRRKLLKRACFFFN